MPDLYLEEIHAKLRQVRRRHGLQDLAVNLPVCLAGAFGLAAVWHIVQGVFGFELVGSGTMLLYLLGGAILAAIGYTLFRLPGNGDAALSLDQTFQLQERVTTVITLDDRTRNSPAGVALWDDTKGRVAGLDIASRFPLVLKRSALALPIAALAFLLTAWLYNPSPSSSGNELVEKKDEKKDPMPVIPFEELKKNSEDRKKRAKDIQAEEFDTIQADLDRLTERLEKADKQQDIQLAIQETSKIAEDIRKRQQDLSKLEAMQKNLKADQALKQDNDGPGKDMQNALAQGDFEKAKEEAEKLLKKLKDKELTEQEKKDLEKKLKDLAEKLNNIADQKERQERVAKSNLDPETKKKELEKIKKDAQKLEDLKKLASKLGQCSQCMSSGDLDKASQSMSEAMSELEELAQNAKESDLLQLTQEDIDKLKQCLGWKGGKGDAVASGKGDSELGGSELATEGDGEQTPGNNSTEVKGGEGGGGGGDGVGGRRGQRLNDTKNQDARARAELDKQGRLLFDGYGPTQPKPDKNTFGKTTLDLANDIAETREQATEALRQQKVPQAQRDVVSEFYKNLTPKKADKK